jgi:oligopeptide transport system substrate-binding protein
MARINFSQFRANLAIVVLSSFLVGCATQATGRFWGQTKAPTENVLRYVSGSEPESLDPHIPTGQPEARVLMAFYDGLVEYHPKTMEAIPAIAEKWEISPDGSEYTFYLRKNAKFSNGDPITAKDFVYSFRRALKPELAAKNAYLAYYIKYAKAYNSGYSFVKDANGQFLLKKDFSAAPAADETAKAGVPAKLAEALKAGETAAPVAAQSAADTEFHLFIAAPERLTVPGDEKSRKELFDKDPKLKAAVEGKQLVPVRAEDVGVEAVDDYTFRMTLYQSAPFFIGLLPHQFFRVVHQPTVEKFGAQWAKPQNIVTSGAFKLAVHKPYDEIHAVRDPNYWDAANVRLDRIEFYPLEEQTTMMNLYKSGEVDATYNATVPAAWKDVVSQYKDEYLNHPEVTIEYYTFTVNKAPVNDLKVRQAFSMAVDRFALAKFRKTTQPLGDFTPKGIFPKYEEARDRVYAELLKEKGITQEEWEKRLFNPEKARQLLTEAGYPVEKSGDGWSSPKFPADKVEVLYNTAESNKAVAEFIQAQWKQNLGVTVPLKNMEWKTFLNVRKNLEYTGFGRAGWVGDYMDPFSFLYLFYSKNNDSSTGWHNPQYDRMLDAANKETDETKRFEMLARAEFFLMQDQPVIPLQTKATNWIKKPYVKGMYPNPGTLHAWKFVYIERDPNKWDANVDNIMKERDASVYEQIANLTKSQDEYKKSKTAEPAPTTNTANVE